MFEFQDRADAGRRLGQRLAELRGQDVVVLGLPRGGVPVAFEVAERLDAPLDVIVVRKLGVPFQPEFAMGAIGEGDARVVDPRVVSSAGVSAASLEAVERRERELLESRVERYRQGRARTDLTGRTALYLSTPKRCAAISGLPDDEAAEVVQALSDHSTRDDNTLRHTWSPRDVVMWDNGAVLHRADHSGVVGDRVMHRGMVATY